MSGLPEGTVARPFRENPPRWLQEVHWRKDEPVPLPVTGSAYWDASHSILPHGSSATVNVGMCDPVNGFAPLQTITLSVGAGETITGGFSLSGILAADEQIGFTPIADGHHNVLGPGAQPFFVLPIVYGVWSSTGIAIVGGLPNYLTRWTLTFTARVANSFGTTFMDGTMSMNITYEPAP